MRYKRRALRAVGSVLDIAPRGHYHRRFVSSESDLSRLAGDWVAVGNDLNDAIEKYNDQFRAEQRPVDATQ